MNAANKVLLAICLAIAVPTPAIGNEAIYLSDTNDFNGNDGISVLYRVEIDEVSNTATITELPNGTVNYNDVSGIAVEPDGSVIWMIDSGGSPPRTLAGYHVASATVFEVGQLSIEDTDNAAMSPTGTLYTTTEAPGKLYTINTDLATVTFVGSLPEAGNGGDLAFDADGTLYMINNNGLFELTLPAVVPGVVSALKIGSGSFPDHTGLAVRANGELIASKHTEDVIQELGTADGSVLAEYLMIDFDHGYGDLAAGPLVRCTRSIGYWKNHGWDGAVVYINGEMIDEAVGRGSAVIGEKPGDGYLWRAKGKTYSMLYAQLIAAKLNAGDAMAIPVIEAAETFLLGKAFDAVVEESEKEEYSGLIEQLDMFNTSYHCDPPIPPGC